MSAPAKSKAALETVLTLKVAAPTAAEASTAAQLYAQVSNDPEAANALKCQAVTLRDELAAPSTSTDAARREQAMRQAIGFAKANV